MPTKKPIYLFYGEEDFLIDEEIDRLKESGKFTEIEIIDGKQATLDLISGAILTQPMFFSKRLVVVKDLPIFAASKSRNAETLTEEEERKKKEEEERQSEQFIKLLKTIGEDGNTVVFTAANVDKRKKVFKSMMTLGYAQEFKPFTEWDGGKVTSWIQSRVKLCGKNIDRQTADLLYEISGSNLRILDSEIYKLVTYIGERNMVEEEDVMALASSGSLGAFALVNALRDKDIPKALAALDKLLKNKERTEMILGSLAAQCRTLLQVKILKSERLGDYQIAETIGGNPYHIKILSEKVHKFQVEELRRDFDLLQQTDIKLKTTSQSPQLLLELLVTDLCPSGQSHG